jgi:hypothetical protein
MVGGQKTVFRWFQFPSYLFMGYLVVGWSIYKNILGAAPKIVGCFLNHSVTIHAGVHHRLNHGGSL